MTNPPDPRVHRPDPATLPEIAWGQRAQQVVLAAVTAVVTVSLMIALHRWTAQLGGVEIPAGLLFGAALQLVASVFLFAVTGARMPLVALAILWGLFAMPFMTRGVGGGVMMPAQMDGASQYSGLIVQALGVGIPFVVAVLASRFTRRRSI